MPGWLRDLPFQRLVRELGRTFPGDSAARFAAGAKIAREVADVGAPALASSFTLAELKARPQDYPPAYLVHEFMPAAWQPLYVTEVRAAMATIGFAPVGSATLIENFDRLVLNRAARQTLAEIEDPEARELARDFFLDQRLRCDVFARGNSRLGAEERAARLLASTFALARPAAVIRHTNTTPAGECAFDIRTARAIVGALADGPHKAADLGSSPDLLENTLTLCAAGDTMPVEPGCEPVGKLNRAIWRRLDGDEDIGWLALPCGTALETGGGLLRLLRDGLTIDDERYPGWRDFLASHGLSAQ
jgi:hypothetical protein